MGAKKKASANKTTAGPATGDAADAQPARFEAALAELEELVESLEQGELSLEESLARFERGVKLARECRDSLAAAEQRVQVLLADESGAETLAPFADAPDADSPERG